MRERERDRASEERESGESSEERDKVCGGWLVTCNHSHVSGPVLSLIMKAQHAMSPQWSLQQQFGISHQYSPSQSSCTDSLLPVAMHQVHCHFSI